MRISLVNLLLYIASLFGIGCGTIREHTYVCTADKVTCEEVRVVIEDLTEIYMPPEIVNVTIRVGVLPSAAGNCVIKGSSFGKVQIVTFNNKFWSGLSVCQRRWLIMHEVGHCLYNMKHGDGIMQERLPRIDKCAKEIDHAKVKTFGQ